MHKFLSAQSKSLARFTEKLFSLASVYDRQLVLKLSFTGSFVHAMFSSNFTLNVIKRQGEQHHDPSNHRSSNGSHPFHENLVRAYRDMDSEPRRGAGSFVFS
ncbi:MAG TPA: hypothetical protein VGO06_00590 [Bosea sp. (in: a-proteobacteria)]|nr:hypothetical protein [Bosea sp. (in: a-proteobacteria)]